MRTPENIAGQLGGNYANYIKQKRMEDVGHFLQNYVVDGGGVTQDPTYNNRIVAEEIVVSLNGDVMRRDGQRFTTRFPLTTWYLDFGKDGDWHWSTSHPAGTASTDYLTISTVTTNSIGNVATITDARGHVGGFLLKDEHGLENYATKAQLAETEKQIAVTPEMFGAIGDGATNDRAAVQAAIDYAIANGYTIVKLSKPYLLKATSTFDSLIHMGSGITLTFEINGKLIADNNGYDGIRVIRCLDITDFSIVNANIVGDKTYTTTPDGTGINILGCKRFNLYNVYIENVILEGVAIRNSAANLSSNGYIDFIRLKNIGRNGVWVDSCDTLNIGNINANGINEYAPYLAVNIEPHMGFSVKDEIKNINIGTINGVNCKGGISVNLRLLINASTLSNVSVNIESAVMSSTNSDASGFLFVNGGQPDKVKGSVRVASFITNNDKACSIQNVMLDGISVNLPFLQATFTGSINNVMSIEGLTNIPASINVGDIFVGTLKYKGNPKYSLYISMETGLHNNSVNHKVRINDIISDNIKPILCMAKGQLTKNRIAEADITELASIYNPGQGFFTYHFWATLYHNKTETGNKSFTISSPLLIDVPITLEVRTAYTFGITRTGLVTYPTTLAFTNGFKSSEVGSSITFKINTDNSVTILSMVGTWVSHT